MCGIAGEISQKKPTTQTLVRGLVSKLKHRGPDSSGFYYNSRVNLGMCRLSIIDVSGGQQPLYNENRSMVIVGNGEIYNYLELNRVLVKKGHTFTTKSDIETAVHAYEEWGPDCFNRFRGMYALAIYDKNNNEVVLARDKMGEKPLYYTNVKGNIVFSSELKSLVNVKNVNKELDYEAIDMFFRYYYIPEPLTPFASIKKLQAGSFVKFTLKNGFSEQHKFWDISKINPKDKDDPTERIKTSFDEACKLTLRSEVPVGIALSGGIDSGSILAHSAPKYKERMKAFSVGYEGNPPTDERKAAQQLAEKFDVEFINVELQNNDAIHRFPEIVYHSDMPIADIAAFAIYSVSKAAQEHGIKVLLGGIGSDELFWGYPSTVETVKGKYVYNNPNPQSTGTAITKIYGIQLKALPPENHLKLLKRNKNNNRLDVARNTLENLHNFWLRSNCITLNDSLSMANSVELRSPFLDSKLVEVAFASQKNLLAYDKPSKYWFKKAMKDTLPTEVLNRPKQGFTPPVAQWLKGIAASYFHLLSDGFLVQSGILHPFKSKILFLYKNPVTAYDLYQMILLEIWGREFVWGQSYQEIEKLRRSNTFINLFR